MVQARQKHDELARMSLPEPLEARELKVLLIGESGAGKSTFINILGNYFLGGTLTSPHVIIPTHGLESTAHHKHSERDTADRTTSKTSRVQKYTWDSVSFIDTPGLADTRGPKQDDKNMLKILEFVGNEEHLSAILIVMNGTKSRVGSNIMTVISRLRGNIPDVALNNIIFVMTNCRNRTFCNFELSSLPFDPCAVMYMDNSCFSSHQSTWSEHNKKLIAMQWDDSQAAIKKLLALLNSMTCFSTAPFRILRSCRACINDYLIRAPALMEAQSMLDELYAGREASAQRHRAIIQRSSTTTETKTFWQSMDCVYNYFFSFCLDISDTTLAAIRAAQVLNMNEMDHIDGSVNLCCTRIMHICSQFNINDELKALVEQLQYAARLQTDHDRRSSLNELVRSLNKIAIRAAAAAAAENHGGSRPTCVIIDASEEV